MAFSRPAYPRVRPAFSQLADYELIVKERPMKIYKNNSKQYGFQMSIPDGWSESLMRDLINFSHIESYQPDPSVKKTDTRTIVGANRKYLNMLITPLLDTEHEPTIDETAEYFDGLSYRKNLNVMATGSINIANKQHFWATYNRGFALSLATGGQMQFYKKYCIYLNRVEYLFTAGLYSFSAGEKPPTDQDLSESEKIFDDMVSSITLLSA
jgi:hypothetical protein